MKDFYYEISKISDKIKLKQGKENFIFVRWFISYFKRLADDIKNELTDISDYELINKVKEKIIHDIKYYSILRNVNVESEIFSYSCYMFYSKHTNKDNLDDFIEKSKNKNYDALCEEFFDLYDSLNYILRLDFGVNSGLDLDYLLTKEQFKQRFLINLDSPLKIFSEKGYTDFLKKYLLKIKKHSEQLLKEIYILNIQSIGEFFETTGSLEKLLILQNNVLSKFMLFDLKIKEGDEKIECQGKKKQIMDEIDSKDFKYFDDNFLDIYRDIESEEILTKIPDNFKFRDTFKVSLLNSLPLTELMVLNCFWQNKFTKELENILRLIVLCDSLNLWQGIFNGSINHINISEFVTDDEYKKVLEKSTYIRRYAEEKYKSCQETTVYRYIESNSYIQKLEKDSNYYKEYFSAFNCENDLGKDVDYFLPFYKSIKQAYFSKTLSIYGILSNISEVKECKNYGIVLTDLKEFKNQKLCEIWIDYPKLSSSLRIHLEKNKLLAFLRKVIKNTAIRIYMGKEDFFDDKNFFSSNVLFPISKSYSKIIVKLAKETDSNYKYYNLINHLCLLANGKFPSHLKIKKANGERIIVKKYIDLESLIIFDDTKESFYKLEDFNC